jgi:hypothetical protein
VREAVGADAVDEAKRFTRQASGQSASAATAVKPFSSIRRWVMSARSS